MKRNVKKFVSAALATIMVVSSAMTLSFSASAVTNGNDNGVGVKVDNSYDAAMQNDGIIDNDIPEDGLGNGGEIEDPVIEPNEPSSEPDTTIVPPATEPQPSTAAPKLALKVSSTTLGVGEKYTLESKTEGIKSTALLWSSSNNSVATVSQNGANAVITAKKTGTATITVKANGMSAACKITVKTAPTRVTISNSDITLGNGETYTLTESTPNAYSNAANLVWSSSNPSVATVTKGVGNRAQVKAVNTGTAKITIKTYNGKTASCNVTVKNAPTSVVLSNSSVALGTGNSFVISESTPNAYSNAENLVWSSSNPSVATVTKGAGNKATITAKKSGEAVIRITTFNGKTAECTVSVANVGTVKNITKTSTDSTKVSLKWDKVSGASGYVIYYLNADKNKNYSKVKEVTSNSATISDLAETTQYYFKVAAYVNKNGVKYEGAATIKKTCTQAADIKNLSLNRSSDVIELSWSKVANATGYKIYRACESTNWSYKEYKTLKGSGSTTLTDKNVSVGNQYRYCIKAYRQLYGNCYYYSTGVTKVAYAGLGAPTVNVVSRLSKANLSWGKNKYATGYEIYYSKNNKNNFTKLATTKNNFYNSYRLEVGKTYYFRVRAYRTLTVNGKKTDVPGTYYTYSVKVVNTAYGQSVGKTYIEISIKEQRMWFYKNGEYILDTYVVTGNDDGYHNTPTGVYSIWQRQSPATLVGSGYSSRVSYWLAFTYSGCGIHDASWRSAGEYGGTTYKGNGSHGCVNTPYNKVKTIYNNVGIGTKVILY